MLNAAFLCLMMSQLLLLSPVLAHRFLLSTYLIPLSTLFPFQSRKEKEEKWQQPGGQRRVSPTNCYMRQNFCWPLCPFYFGQFSRRYTEGHIDIYSRKLQNYLLIMIQFSPELNTALSCLSSRALNAWKTLGNII